MKNEKSNKLNREAAIFMINDRKQVLLEKRIFNKNNEQIRWALCAGHTISNEKGMETALSEMNGELGIDILKSDVHKYYEKESINDSNVLRLVDFCYVIVNKKEDDFLLQTNTVIEVKWFDIEEIIKRIDSKDSTIYTKERIYLFDGLKLLMSKL